jgi:hypothetical protein
MNQRPYDPNQASIQQEERAYNSYCVSNMFELIDNGRIFEYDLKFSQEHQLVLQENKELFYQALDI